MCATYARLRVATIPRGRLSRQPATAEVGRDNALGLMLMREPLAACR